MLRHIIFILEKIRKKFPFLKYNTILRACYHRAMMSAPYRAIVKPGRDAARFFTANADRVNAVADLLADQQSKKEYLGAIKFRQTFHKKDSCFAGYAEAQYFLDLVRFNKDEVFVDCGAYNGDTIESFFEHCKEYRQIVAFEPEAKNFEELKNKYGGNPKITLIKAGTYDKDGIVTFDPKITRPNRTSGRVMECRSKKDKEYFVNIEVRAIDNLNLENVTYIKMDVEGAELNSLQGAKQTILRDKPKLAVSIYHSDEDMVRIAEYIHGLNLGYKLYVRHYGKYPYCKNDTVLYALF